MLLCINASDEKDIKTIRNKIKTFANFSVNKDDEYKIILLDEADSLSIES
jgi:DNA polymerase III delta prime subunit